MSIILITGGAGFIGSNLVRTLNDSGLTDIVIADSLGNQGGIAGKWRTLLGKKFRDIIPKSATIGFIEKHRRDLGAIIHLGACSSTQEMDMDFLMENNIRLSQKIILLAAEFGIRCIYASSAATYGIGERGFDDDPSLIRSIRPINPYGFSKHFVDCWLLDKQLEDKACGLKFFNVYGPNEYHKGRMRSLVLTAHPQILETGTIRLFKSTDPQYPDGGQRRDFIYVKDCCDAVLWLLENPQINGVYNVGTGASRTWNDLAHALFAAMDLPSQIEYIDMPPSLVPGYQNFTEATMTRLHHAGWTGAQTSLEEGVRDYVQGYLALGGAIR
jgi:ADP-L-glycero-D-manno-heptose 6-epimerase